MLLEIEYNHEKEEFRKQTETMGVERKIRRGDAWYPVAIGASYYNSLNQLVVEVTRRPGSDIEHNFEPGRPVCFFVVKRGAATASAKAASAAHDDRIEYMSFTATVSYAEQDRMVIALPDGGRLADLQRSEPIGVQLFFDETSYRLMFDALDRVLRAKTGRLAALRDIFYTAAPARQLTFEPTRFPWLNPSQERAVNEVLRAKDVAIVHGPPGTGKTTTLVEAVYETLRRESQVMVCAQSNMAVDWISEKLVDRGVPVLRIGNPTRVNDKMLSFTYERRFEAHPDYPQLWSIRKAMRQLRSERKRSDSWHQKMERLKSRAAELELRIRATLFGEARVIACTLTGSANRVLEGEKYSTLFIDEAAQALEAACWIAIRKAGRVILAGDHCQLPPTVKSIMALKGGLGVTLMERLVKLKPEVVTLLKMQYRMNEQIMRFSGDWFYGGEVETSPTVAGRGILDYDLPMQWIDTAEVDGKEEFVGESFGRVNRAEAELTLAELQRYFEKIGRERIVDEHIDVGVISPYRAQVQLLRKMLRQSEFFRPYRSHIAVNTVDGFQGQERDIILISLVRDNAEGDIGFLRDLRRMNVAITRARMKLIILGSASTMTAHPFYKKLYEYVESLRME